ncbi:N-alpha-acetyltransferase 35 NatC auxiliary subunit [Sparganum proliferum]
MSESQIDITEKFRQACETCLQPGDIAHEKYFGLQHAMSAIEIMNQSMDVGMQKDRRVLYLHEAVESGFLSFAVFSDQTILLGVIDELLASFVNWITGDSLAQTVYTCMYMHCIPFIHDPYLSAFCEAFRRCILKTRDLILESPVFEEEDFCAMTYGVPLGVDTVANFPTLTSANSLFSLPDSDLSNLLNGLESDLAHANDRSDTRNAIAHRIRFARLFHNVLCTIAPLLTNKIDCDFEELAGVGDVCYDATYPSSSAPDGLQYKLGTSQSATHLLCSWICIESPSVRKQLLAHIPVLEKFNSFFDHVGSQLVAISRGFCFNRSRQRSNMEQIFARMHELLEDSCNIESALVSALTESQGTDPPNHRSPPSSSSLTLHLAAYVCFFYYHLAWDYVSTGFQLDLYSCHEWVYMYSFEINIFRSLTSLLQHIITPWLQETEGGADGKSGTEAINNQNTSNAVAKRSGRRRRRKAHEETHESAQVATDGVSPSLLVELDACAVGLDYWKYQMELANMHRFICAATIYVLRAFQREVGIDLNSLEQGPAPGVAFTPGQRRFYGSLRTQFIRRLGSLISSPTSPLADPGGAMAAFRSAHEYLVMGHFADCSTTDLYQLASKIYGVARQCLRNAESLLAKLRSPGSFYATESGLLPLGPVDSLADVDHLAKNNYVVTRLLAARPEKRPNAKQLPANRPPDLRSPRLSVRLDFTFLPSRMYPLLRLAS